MAPNPESRRFSPRRWPVRWRLAAVSASLTLVILVAFAVVVGQLATSRVQDDFRDDLVSVASQLRLNISVGRVADAGIVVRGTDLKEMAAVGDAVVKVVDGGGQTLPTPTGLAQTPGAPDLGSPQPGITEVGSFDVVSLPVSTGGLTGETSWIQYARNRHSLEATLNHLWLFLFGGVVGGTLLAALAGIAVASRAMRPISSLTAAAREIAATRDPSRRLPMPETEDEVAELAKTLDQMLRELDAARGETQQMIQAQREFVADASHELRTPLTSILANLELLQARLEERDEGDDEEAEMVAGALGSSRRMRRLVSDLLLLARADAGRAGPRRGCDLGAIAADALAEVAPVAADHGLNLDRSGPVPIEGNPDDLHRLALNLLENAVRHTPPRTRVDTRVYARDGEGVLEVSDDGPGLPRDAGEQLFERFVRGGGPADVSADAGTGLGLAIVKAVASSHGGRVEFGSSSSGGARFTVRLPLGEVQVPDREPAAVA